MTGTTMVVLIVFISVGFGVMFDMYKKHLEFKTKTHNLNVKSNAEQDKMQTQISTLEERIKVLEKIVTDEGYSVQQEINRL